VKGYVYVFISLRSYTTVEHVICHHVTCIINYNIHVKMISELFTVYF
jgi:hypothetical protein